MAATGKTLTVYLAADVSKLKNGLNSADRSLSGFGKNLTSMVGPALIGATAAAGAFALALAVDGVQAAIQEEAELAKLGKTVENLGFGAQTDEINAFVESMQYSVGISDSELRPSLSRLLTATKDVTEAQRLLSLSADVAAGTGRTLEQTTSAIAKAAEGNFGALKKLGAGIDESTIKSKDLEGALSQLGTTFSGQATTAANTLQGQIKILSISFDELKESFGTGFLRGLAGGGSGMKDLSQAMRDAQDTADSLGMVLGDTSMKLLDLLNNTVKTAKAFNEWGKENKKFDMPEWIKNLGGGLTMGFSVFASTMDKVAAKTDAATAALQTNMSNMVLWSNTAMSMDQYVRGGYSGIPVNSDRATMSQSAWLEKIMKMEVATKKATTSTGGMTSAVKAMDPALRKQIDLVKELTNKVGDAAKKLETARKEMNDWISSMAQNITSGIDLGAAFDSMFYQTGENAGKLNGQSLLEGFNKQIEQAGLFGDYLKRLNTEGGPELRDAVAKLGPEAGNKLAKEIIDQGLIPTMQSKLVDVQSMAETTAAEMVPPMLVAGVASASGYLIKMQNELDASTSMLEEMGRKMGKTLSEAMVEEIRAALAAAGVAQTGASNVMAGLPADAISAQAQVAQRIDNPFMNSTAIMQAIQNAIQQSDQRLGRTGQVLNA
jgi:hypothetical protein